METNKSKKGAAAGTTLAADNGDGKNMLRGLILQAEEVLGKLIYKLEKTPLTMAEMVTMINSVHAFVEMWEKPLEDIRLDMLNIPGVGDGEKNKSKEEAEKKILEQISLLDLKGDEGRKLGFYNGLDKPAEPTFEFLEQSLANYKPNHTGRCVVSSVGSGQRQFCMVDRDHPDGTKLFAAMQSMSSARITQLPPPGEVFGVYLEGALYRAVRNKPNIRSFSRKDYIRLLDTGEIIPYDGALSMCALSEYYRRIPAFAIRCLLVSVIDDPFCEDFDRYLKKMLNSTLHFKVVSSEKHILFVELSKHRILPNDPFSTPSTPGSTPPKVKPILGRRCRSAPLSSSPPKPPRSTIFAIDPVEQKNPFTSIRFPSAPTAGKRYCPFDESNCATGAHSKNGHMARETGEAKQRIVPPVGSHLMLMPKFIRDVGHIWCHVVTADYVNPDFREMELRMNDPEYSRQYRKLQQRPKIAQRVFAKYIDKRWYRAEVVRFFDDRNVMVFYVDYGNSEMVRQEEVHEWDDQFSYLPYQAVLCKLSNLQPAKSFHVPAVVELNRTLLNKRVHAKIVDNKYPWEITILDQDGFDIASGLVIASLARRIKEEDEPEPGQEAPAA